MILVHIGVTTTSLAIANDGMVLENDQVCLRVEAAAAENKLLDEAVKEVLQSSCVVGSINNVSVIVVGDVNLSTELASKKLCWIYKSGNENLDQKRATRDNTLTARRSVQGTSNVRHVHNDGLDAVTSAFNLGGQLGHFISIERIIDVAADIHVRHDGTFCLVIKREAGVRQSQTRVALRLCGGMIVRIWGDSKVNAKMAERDGIRNKRELYAAQEHPNWFFFFLVGDLIVLLGMSSMCSTKRRGRKSGDMRGRESVEKVSLLSLPLMVLKKAKKSRFIFLLMVNVFGRKEKKGACPILRGPELAKSSGSWKCCLMLMLVCRVCTFTISSCIMHLLFFSDEMNEFDALEQFLISLQRVQCSYFYPVNFFRRLRASNCMIPPLRSDECAGPTDQPSLQITVQYEERSFNGIGY